MTMMSFLLFSGIPFGEVFVRVFLEVGVVEVELFAPSVVVDVAAVPLRTEEPAVPFGKSAFLGVEEFNAAEDSAWSGNLGLILGGRPGSGT